MRPGRRQFAGGGRRRIQQLAAASIIAAGVLQELPTLPSRADPTQTAQDEIRSALENWRSAFNERDYRRVCDLFAPDLVANYKANPSAITPRFANSCSPRCKIRRRSIIIR